MNEALINTFDWHSREFMELKVYILLQKTYNETLLWLHNRQLTHENP